MIRRMSEIIYPRSPREVMCGWMHLPRFIDKVRLHLAGRLHPDYQPNLCKGFDGLWLETAGVEAQQFIEVVRNSLTDGEVCDWVRKNVKQPESVKAAHRERMLNYPEERRRRDAGAAQDAQGTGGAGAPAMISRASWTSLTPTREGARLGVSRSPCAPSRRAWRQTRPGRRPASRALAAGSSSLIGEEQHRRQQGRRQRQIGDELGDSFHGSSSSRSARTALQHLAQNDVKQ